MLRYVYCIGMLLVSGVIEFALVVRDIDFRAPKIKH